MKKVVYIVVVEAPDEEKTAEVMTERLNHDEDLGFDYTIEWWPWQKQK